MSQIVLGPNRAYPAIPTVGNELESHSRALEAIVEALQIHERRTANTLDSFVRVGELQTLGLIDVDGNIVTDNASDTDASDSHNHDSLYIRLDGSSPATTGSIEMGAGLDVVGGLTADTYSGITNVNLVDKTAVETITGAWTFDGAVDFNDNVTVDGTFRIYDSLSTDYVQFDHDGTDFNITGVTTANLNLTGFASIQAGTVDADFDAITATSYGGILEANLLDKTAAETVSGQYTFSTDIFGLSGFSVQGSTTDIGQVGQFAFVDVSGGLSRFGSYNYDTASYTALQVRGLTTEIVGDTSVTISSPTLIAGSTDADFDAITATSYGGILEANLLDKTAVETVSGAWTFTSALGLSVENIDARFWIEDTNAAVDEGTWLMQSTAGTLRHYSANDARNSFDEYMKVDRTGVVIDLITLHNDVLMGLDLDVTGALTANGVLYLSDGSAALPSLAFTNATTSGLYQAGGNIGVSIAGSLEVVFGPDRTEFYDTTHAHGGASALGTIADVGQVGQFAFMDVSGGIGRFGSYNYDTVAWMPAAFSGRSATVNAIGDGSFNLPGDNSANFTGLGDQLNLFDGMDLRIWDSTDTDYADFSHNGVDFNTTFVGTTDWNIDGVLIRFRNTGGIRVQDGAGVRIFDATDTDYIDVNHDGTDAALTFQTTDSLRIDDIDLIHHNVVGGRMQFGTDDAGHTGVFGAKANTDAAGLQYGTYWAYDCYWDETADNWVANRTTLARKFKIEMGYHRNSIDFQYYNGVVTSPWADSAWDTLLQISGGNNRVDVLADNGLRVYGPAGVDYFSINETGANSQLVTNNSNIQIVSGGGNVQFLSGNQVRIQDPGNTDYIALSHDGAHAKYDHINTANVLMYGFTGGVSISPDDNNGANANIGIFSPDHSVTLSTTTSGDQTAFILYNPDGVNNPRAAFFMDDTNLEYGFAQTWSTGAQMDLMVYSASTEKLRWQFDTNILTITANQVGLGNFIFDTDQAVGVGQDNYVLTYDNASGLISLEAGAGGGGINNVVEDTTPQLGGNLDLNGFNITSTVNVNNGIEAGYLGVNSTSATDGHGVSLYNGYVDGQPTYGMHFSGVATFGTHDFVTGGTWATYFTMNNTAGRGWIFRDVTGALNVAGIDNDGNAAFDGKLRTKGALNSYAHGNLAAAGVNHIMYPEGGYLSVDSSNQSGAFLITLPEAFGLGNMATMVIRGYDYTSTHAAWAIQIGFYDYATTDTFLNYNVSVIAGDPPFDIVAFQTDDITDQMYIQLGDETDTNNFQYPQIWIESYNPGFSNQWDADLLDGWGISLVTDATNRTNVATRGLLGHYSTNTSEYTFRGSALTQITFQGGADILLYDGGEYRAYDADESDYIYMRSSGATSSIGTEGAGAGTLYLEPNNGIALLYEPSSDGDWRVYSNTGVQYGYMRMFTDRVEFGSSSGDVYLEAADDVFIYTKADGTQELAARFNEDAGCQFYWNGTGPVLQTVDRTASDQVSGATVADGNGTGTPVGFNVMKVYERDTAWTLAQSYVGFMVHRDTTTSIDYTCPNSSTIPNGATWAVTNEGNGGTFRIKGATGVTVRHFDGSTVASVTAGNGFTLAYGGVATVLKYADTEYWIWGAGITTS